MGIKGFDHLYIESPRFEESVFNFTAAGYVPVITHPERLTWIEGHYGVVESLARLEGRISEADMSAMNARAKLDKVTEEQVAAA